jgi:hypothetical protein
LVWLSVAAARDPIPLPDLTDAVLTLVRDDKLAGHVNELRPGGRSLAGMTPPGRPYVRDS